MVGTVNDVNIYDNFITTPGSMSYVTGSSKWQDAPVIVDVSGGDDNGKPYKLKWHFDKQQITLKKMD